MSSSQPNIEPWIYRVSGLSFPPPHNYPTRLYPPMASIADSDIDHDIDPQVNAPDWSDGVDVAVTLSVNRDTDDSDDEYDGVRRTQ